MSESQSIPLTATAPDLFGVEPQRRATAPAPAGPVVFFDGICGLCNRFVDFVLRHDVHGTFHFAPLQGELASECLPPADTRDLSTIVLLEQGKSYRKSDAVIRVLRSLGGIWAAMAMFIWVVPRPLRDAGYGWIARNRYSLFGKRETCRLPTADERGRILP